MSKPWYDELERKASNLRSIIAVLVDRIENSASPDRDVITDNLLDVASTLAYRVRTAEPLSRTR